MPTGDSVAQGGGDAERSGGLFKGFGVDGDGWPLGDSGDGLRVIGAADRTEGSRWPAVPVAAVEGSPPPCRRRGCWLPILGKELQEETRDPWWRRCPRPQLFSPLGRKKACRFNAPPLEGMLGRPLKGSRVQTVQSPVWKLVGCPGGPPPPPPAGGRRRAPSRALPAPVALLLFVLPGR